MKKKFALFLICCIIILPKTGFSYTIDDTTYVGKGKSYNSQVPAVYNNQWVDFIGTNFDTYGIDVGYDPATNSITLKIYTEYGSTNPDVGGFDPDFADIFFDTGSGYTYAIDWQTGNIYSGVTAQTSFDIVEPYRGLYYGEVWYGSQSPYVNAASYEDITGTAGIDDSNWSKHVGYYEIIFNLDALGPLTDSTFSFFWGTATCANDTIEGRITVPAVPEPATMMLLGVGLIGLAGLGRKKFRKN